MRDPLVDPEPGDVVASQYDAIPHRRVLKVSPANIRYRTVQGAKSVERDCLPVTWQRWCRRHRATVVN